MGSCALNVSILTGPFGPVLLATRFRVSIGVIMFQSSPALSGRCCPLPQRVSLYPSPRFNPHRPFRAGAAFRRACGATRTTFCFNPHRPFRAGAAVLQARDGAELWVFQSSPALSGRCCVKWSSVEAISKRVSILTGPFGPVLHSSLLEGRTPGGGVSILTGPFGPVLPAQAASRLALRRCFNPHRPFRAGAAVVGLTSRARDSAFQSSPALSGRCCHSRSWSLRPPDLGRCAGCLCRGR